eukprot:978044-Rhodomonas_salina.1
MRLVPVQDAAYYRGGRGLRASDPRRSRCLRYPPTRLLQPHARYNKADPFRTIACLPPLSA